MTRPAVILRRLADWLDWRHIERQRRRQRAHQDRLNCQARTGRPLAHTSVSSPAHQRRFLTIDGDKA